MNSNIKCTKKALLLPDQNKSHGFVHCSPPNSTRVRLHALLGRRPCVNSDNIGLQQQKPSQIDISSATVWGIGHSTVLLIAGTTVLILRIAIPESVMNIFELAAASVLLMRPGIHILRLLATEIIFSHQNEIEKNYSSTPAYSFTFTIPEISDKYENHQHLQKAALTGVLQGMGGTATQALVTLTTVNKIEGGLDLCTTSDCMLFNQMCNQKLRCVPLQMCTKIVLVNVLDINSAIRQQRGNGALITKRTKGGD